jgi:hypothetical protein
MVSFLRDLFPYLVAFYLLDALLYARRGQRILVAPWGRRFSLRAPGLHWIGPSPTAESVAAHSFPGAITSAGVFALRPDLREEPTVWEPFDFEFAPFDALDRLIVEGRELRAGPWRMPFASAAAARRWGAVLRELRDTVPAERPRRIREVFRDAADVDAAERLRRCHGRFAPLLRTLSAALFAVVFALLPWSLYSDAVRRPALGPVLLSAGILYAAVVAVSALSLHRCRTPRRDAAWTLLSIVAFPPAAMHVLTTVPRELYVRFEPPTLAALLLPESEAKRLARVEWHRLQAARASSAGSELASFWEMRGEMWRSIWRRHGWTQEEMLAPPHRTDPDAAAYCPLCSLQYARGDGDCADCGVPLKAFLEETGSR